MIKLHRLCVCLVSVSSGDGGRLSSVQPDPRPREDPTQPPPAHQGAPAGCGQSSTSSHRGVKLWPAGYIWSLLSLHLAAEGQYRISGRAAAIPQHIRR